MHKKGFTLIEIIVTIAALAIVLPTIFSIFFVILQQQSRLYKLSEVKRQGDLAVSAMENIIRNNAVKILDTKDSSGTPVCIDSSYIPGDTETLAFEDKYGNRFDFHGTEDTIDPRTEEFGGVVPTPAFSNAPLVIYPPAKVSFGPILGMTCDRFSPYSPPIVNLSFTIHYRTTSPRPEDQVTLSYQTSIALRNFASP